MLGLSFLPIGRAAMASRGILGYALKKLAHNRAKYAGSRFASNVPNELPGFYAGGRAAKASAMGKGFLEGAKTTVKQATSLDASKASRFGGISKVTYDINNNNIKAIHSILKDPKNWDMRKGKFGKLKNDSYLTVKHLSKQIQEYQPQPDPVAEQRTQLEMQLLQAQIANESAKAQENAVDVEYKKAKTQTELAKSRNLNSKSDLDDLNFVEQESGVNRQHEQDLKATDQQNTMDQKFADAIINEPMLNQK